VTKEQDNKEAFKWVKDSLGGVDILVNNAGADRNNTLCGNSDITLFTVTLLCADSLGWYKEEILQAEIQMQQKFWWGNRWGTISRIMLTVTLVLM
jgi:NAD(P)-dependent dehydrogenase (short-subunit alcohol dehydrogenase family)